MKAEALKGKKVWDGHFEVFHAPDVASAVEWLKEDLANGLDIPHLDYVIQKIDEAFADVVEKKEEGK